MAGEKGVGSQMAASYSVEITGIERTRAELSILDGLIKEIRKGEYTPLTNISVASELGSRFGSTDLLVTKLDAMEGRIQGAVQKTMIAGMDMGKDLQAETLRAAETNYGRQRMARGKGKSAGRELTGGMVKALRRSVESMKDAGSTTFTGWHGWGLNAKGNRMAHFEYQEKGTRLGNRKRVARDKTIKTLTKAHRGQGGNWNTGVPAANSLGQAIVPVREFLKKELGKLR